LLENASRKGSRGHARSSLRVSLARRSFQLPRRRNQDWCRIEVDVVGFGLFRRLFRRLRPRVALRPAPPCNRRRGARADIDIVSGDVTLHILRLHWPTTHQHLKLHRAAFSRHRRTCMAAAPHRRPPRSADVATGDSSGSYCASGHGSAPLLPMSWHNARTTLAERRAEETRDEKRKQRATFESNGPSALLPPDLHLRQKPSAGQRVGGDPPAFGSGQAKAHRRTAHGASGALSGAARINVHHPERVRMDVTIKMTNATLPQGTGLATPQV